MTDIDTDFDFEQDSGLPGETPDESDEESSKTRTDANGGSRQPSGSHRRRFKPRSGDAQTRGGRFVAKGPGGASVRTGANGRSGLLGRNGGSETGENGAAVNADSEADPGPGLPAGSDQDGSFLPPSFDDPEQSGLTAGAVAGRPQAGSEIEPEAGPNGDSTSPSSPLSPEQDWLDEAETHVGPPDFEGLGNGSTAIPGPAQDIGRADGTVPRRRRGTAFGLDGDDVDQPPAQPPSADGGRGGRHLPRVSSRRAGEPKPARIKKLRLAVIVLGVGGLALVSTVFGMMMAVAQDLPALEQEKQYAAAQNSEVFDARGRPIGQLLSNNQRILLTSDQISPYVKEAVVAIEDQRFYEHAGVDFQGIARAVVQDVIPGGSVQGASTITQQFVKNALEAQDSRTVFQKLRESALAYHLERQWDKDKILTQYLNTIYFGEGAYGIEAAARTYFSRNHPGCGLQGGEPCASVLAPEEAALLAGLITSPSQFSPRVNPDIAVARRDLILDKMAGSGVISGEELASATAQLPPAPSDIEKPTEDSEAPYFTSWLRQVVVDTYGAGQAFGGGLDIHSSLDLDMQRAAEEGAFGTLAGVLPTASVVVLKNDTGEIKAMVGGNDFAQRPFNTATQGFRQPGSTFKPFILAAALEQGISPGAVYSSRVKEFRIPGVKRNKEVFEVHNYEDNYSTSIDLTRATWFSDNSVFAELGVEDVGTRKVASLAEDLGIETPVSTNPAMTLGALELGVTPLEMTHAYETIAADGNRVSGTLDTIPGNDPKNPHDDGPVPIKRIDGPDGQPIARNETVLTRVLPERVARTEKGILHGVLTSGTGKLAAIGSANSWGKTGTTENFGDAWFCGADETFTTCVWVGYRDATTPMQTEYNGEPVAGGTFPAIIWARVMVAIGAIQDQIEAENAAAAAEESGTGSTSTAPADTFAPDAAAPAPAEEAPAPGFQPPAEPPAAGGGSGL